ncbi:MAG: ROK family protein [Hungatella sp.]|nr:ROK family protein [Hungatella sp.]
MRAAVLDIGGTSIKSGVWNGEELTDVKEWDTNAKQGGLYVVNRAVEILKSYEPFEAIGISTAGQVNSKEGYIRYANENIPGYTGMRLRERMENEFGVSAAVENDVNAAALGEAWFGAGKDYDDFLCITYGTGVGGAIVIGKEVYTGSMFSAGEFGGILIHPEDRVKGDPFSGCYEKYASTTALVAKALEYDESLTNGRSIFSRLEEERARAIVDQWIDEMAHGLVTIIHIFNPSCIILGGGVMEQPYILNRLEQKTKGRIMDSFRNVVIKGAVLGNRAGLMGASWLAVRRLRETQ